MRLTILLLPLLSLPACTTIGAEPENLVDQPSYRAYGSPGWRVEVGDDIVLRLGHAFFDGEPPMDAIYRYPATLPRELNGSVRRWRSGRGRGGIVVETRPGPCATPGGQVLSDHVLVLHHGRELTGCGEPWTGERDS